MNPKRTKMISVRASEEEIARVKELVRKLKAKHRYLKEADVLRELIGLESTGLITAEMRHQLSSRIERIDKVKALDHEGERSAEIKPEKKEA